MGGVSNGGSSLSLWGTFPAFPGFPDWPGDCPGISQKCEIPQFGNPRFTFSQIFTTHRNQSAKRGLFSEMWLLWFPWFLEILEFIVLKGGCFQIIISYLRGFRGSRGFECSKRTAPFLKKPASTPTQNCAIFEAPRCAISSQSRIASEQ